MRWTKGYVARYQKLDWLLALQHRLEREPFDFLGGSLSSRASRQVVCEGTVLGKMIKANISFPLSTVSRNGGFGGYGNI